MSTISTEHVSSYNSNNKLASLLQPGLLTRIRSHQANMSTWDLAWKQGNREEPSPQGLCVLSGRPRADVQHVQQNQKQSVVLLAVKWCLVVAASSLPFPLLFLFFSWIFLDWTLEAKERLLYFFFINMWASAFPAVDWNVNSHIKHKLSFY